MIERSGLGTVTMNVLFYIILPYKLNRFFSEQKSGNVREIFRERTDYAGARPTGCSCSCSVERGGRHWFDN